MNNNNKRWHIPQGLKKEGRKGTYTCSLATWLLNKVTMARLFGKNSAKIII